MTKQRRSRNVNFFLLSSPKKLSGIFSLGEGLARMELFVMLANLLNQYKVGVLFSGILRIVLWVLCIVLYVV
jgi:hypothetical protein